MMVPPFSVKKDNNKKTLIVVDMQRDFMEGGSLPVPGALEMVPVIESLVEYFEGKGLFKCRVFLTQDWHPKNHVSFAVNHPGKNIFDEIEYKPRFSEPYAPMGKIIEEIPVIKQKLWPVHCVQDTFGAESILEISLGIKIKKGLNSEIDSYSAFFDNGKLLETNLNPHLQLIDKDPSEIDLYICGVATEYCVYFTAKDALELGYNVYLIEDLCRGIDKATVVWSLSDLEKNGAKIIKSGEINL